MIKYALITLFTLGSFQSSEEISTQVEDVKVGTVLKIGEATTSTYAHINFPRANFIIKRGGLANYKSVEGNHVVVTDVVTKANGEKVITFERKNGQKFFRNYTSVSANLAKALEAGELSIK
ncbi:hypothetical protein U1E44_15715 [Arenibacter sp. GZD96]|uniref:hypothetical protein n=1 Tax=Aurantibrevibacter litoralis TaxID=3106030 RepID=UPI002AFFBEBA|nr:hypothetical protein [Arenibacter sp. GZD-96]MEA1787549.1 hypothetical protein [Arenibacter sp. GZD-96]